MNEVTTFDPSNGLPWPTLAVNITGSFLLGAVLGLAPRLPPWAHPLVAVGLCGALTTFSGLAVEAVELARADRWAVASTYLALTAAGAVTAVLAGRGMAQRLAERPT